MKLLKKIAQKGPTKDANLFTSRFGKQSLVLNLLLVGSN